jgi:hypothetical protein
VNHMLKLTNGAAQTLAQLAGTPGLLTDAASLYRVGAFAEAHLSDLAESPEQPEQAAKPAEWRAWQKAQLAWARAIGPAIEVSEKTRDSLKALVQAGATKGALPASLAVAPLLLALGLAEADPDKSPCG